MSNHAYRRMHGGAYISWEGMHYRCRLPTNPSYARYGGRGIKVCERWASFENFLEDMGPKPTGKSLGRLNNDQDYSPENCAWQDLREQARNTSYNRIMFLNGESRTMTEWSERTGKNVTTIKERINRGWTVEQALLLPVGTKLKKQGRKRVTP